MALSKESFNVTKSGVEIFMICLFSCISAESGHSVSQSSILLIF